jgi:hypothetical protein
LLSLKHHGAKQLKWFFAVLKPGIGGDDRPICAACGRRLTEILVFPETGTGDFPVKFEICMKCQADVVETLRRHMSRRASSLRH